MCQDGDKCCYLWPILNEGNLHMTFLFQRNLWIDKFHAFLHLDLSRKRFLGVTTICSHDGNVNVYFTSENGFNSFDWH